jgi:hypothetical protein
MNGRCETDPLDRAEDVCDSCYGEFCGRCLIYLPGRRYPFCTDCALLASGVRGRSKPPERGSRRTAKKRREALRAADADEHGFRYFDHGGDRAGEQQEPASISGQRLILPDKPEDDPLRSDPVPALGLAQGEAAEVVSIDDRVVRLELAVPGAGSDAPPVSGGLAAAGPATPAVARLAEIRREGHATGPPPSGGEGGEGGGERVGDHLPAVGGVVGGQGGNGPVAVAGDGGGGQGPPMRRASDQPPDDHRLTAPMIGDVRQIGDPSAAPEPPVGDRHRPGTADEVVRTADHAGGEPQGKRRHDVDANGNWIPPILRGLAAGARKAGGDLPRRRRADD